MGCDAVKQESGSLVRLCYIFTPRAGVTLLFASLSFLCRNLAITLLTDKGY